MKAAENVTAFIARASSLPRAIDDLGTPFCAMPRRCFSGRVHSLGSHVPFESMISSTADLQRQLRANALADKPARYLNLMNLVWLLLMGLLPDN
ncbi:MAG: hypothetical protein ACLTDR_09805 [Adlercreutzia equolifaciens]